MIPVKDNTKVGYYNNGRAISGQRMLLGQNLSGCHEFSPETYYKDAMKTGYTSGVGNDLAVGPDASGWFDCTVVGTSWTAILWAARSELADDSVAQRSQGRWVIKWSGTGDIELSSTAGTLVSSVANRAVYDMDSSRATSWLRIDNGYPTDIVVVKEEDEVAFDAGDDTDSKLISNLAGVPVIRFMDMMNTNASYARDYSEYQTILGGLDAWSVSPYVPMSKIAEICNLSVSDPWVCIPAMATDACVTSMANDLFAALDVDKKVYVEYGNEIWNFAGAFKNSWRFSFLGDIPVYEATVDPVTASVNQVAHGLTTGDELSCFNTPEHSVFPYALGSAAFVIVDDVDNFRLATSNALALAGTDDAPLDAKITKLRYKIFADGILDQFTNYAIRSVEIWDIFKGVFGDRSINVGGSQAVNVNVTNGILAHQPFREKFDYIAIAPYFNIDQLTDFELKSYAEIQTYLTDVEFPYKKSFVDDQNDVIGRNALLCYEGGDHSFNDANTPAQITYIESWATSQENADSFVEYVQMLADSNVKLFCNFNMTLSSAGGEAFGMMNDVNDTSAPRYVSYLAEINKGGVGK